jgi:predicted ATPase
MPWKEIYIQDEHRYENYEQAELIFNHLIETYNSFNYLPIEVPKGNVEERIDFILKNL